MPGMATESISPEPVGELRKQTSGRIGDTDVERAESAVRELRALDYRFGGGHNRATLASLLDWGSHMIAGTATQSVLENAYMVVADIQNLTGWTEFDVGHINAALRHFDKAAELARLGRAGDLVANVFYRIGRVHLHHGAPDRALTAFESGMAAVEPGQSSLSASILHINQAWVHASTNALGQALTCLGQAREDFANADPAEAPAWAGFFTEVDLAAMTGIVYSELASRVDRRYTAFAIPALEEARDAYGPGMTRSKVFTLTALAVNRLLEGDVSTAIKETDVALGLAAGVDSARVRDRMAPLRAEVNRRCTQGHGDDLRDLAQRMAIFAHRGRAGITAQAPQAAGTHSGP